MNIKSITPSWILLNASNFSRISVFRCQNLTAAEILSFAVCPSQGILWSNSDTNYVRFQRRWLLKKIEILIFFFPPLSVKLSWHLVLIFVSHESFCIWLIIRDMIRLPLFNVNVVLLLTISVIKHITEFLTVIGHYQQSATCEIEKVYYWRLRRPFESCAMEKQNGDKGVTHINRPMVVS